MIHLKNILSLFDGCSCGQVALNRAGITFENYYASEIDKYAKAVTQKNHPNTIQLGDVRTWESWNLPEIDLLMGGFPCTDLSLAGKQVGFSTSTKQEIHTLEQYLELKKDGFEFEGQSYLFWEYVNILKTLKPKYFLAENVMMAKKWEDIITTNLQVKPVMLNSSLVSGQNRKRLYWQNISSTKNPFSKIKESGITLPEDKFILLKDVLLNESDPRTLTLVHSEKAIAYMDREVKGGRTHWDFKHHSDSNDSKSQTIVANFFKGVPYNVLKDNGLIRKFHPIEAERLQTMEDNYTAEGIDDDGQLIKISGSQRFRMLGNGWTIDIIKHIFEHLK